MLALTAAGEQQRRPVSSVMFGPGPTRNMLGGAGFPPRDRAPAEEA